jgi:hypothetical protein
MTKSCALLNFDRLYVTSYDAIWKMDGKHITLYVVWLGDHFMLYPLYKSGHVTVIPQHEKRQKLLS